MRVTVTDNQDPSSPGAGLAYTVTVTNLDPAGGAGGGDTATNVKLEDILVDKPYSAFPILVNITPTQGSGMGDVTPTQGTCQVGHIVESTPSFPPLLFSRYYGERAQCDLGDIAPQAFVTVTVNVYPDLNTFVLLQPAGIIVNTARATSDTLDSNPQNNVAAEPTTISR
ncbi:MAG: hypothetical protein ACRDIU_03260 [Actinomycetota bacterium]